MDAISNIIFSIFFKSLVKYILRYMFSNFPLGNAQSFYLTEKIYL